MPDTKSFIKEFENFYWNAEPGDEIEFEINKDGEVIFFRFIRVNKN